MKDGKWQLTGSVSEDTIHVHPSIHPSIRPLIRFLITPSFLPFLLWGVQVKDNGSADIQPSQKVHIKTPGESGGDACWTDTLWNEEEEKTSSRCTSSLWPSSKSGLTASLFAYTQTHTHAHMHMHTHADTKAPAVQHTSSGFNAQTRAANQGTRGWIEADIHNLPPRGACWITTAPLHPSRLRARVTPATLTCGRCQTSSARRADCGEPQEQEEKLSAPWS